MYQWKFAAAIQVNVRLVAKSNTTNKIRFTEFSTSKLLNKLVNYLESL